MSRSIQKSRLSAAAAASLALGLVGLGVLSLVYRDFTLQWEPVPAGVHDRTLLALASGAILTIAGLLLPVGRTRAWGALLAAIFIGFWVVGLHLPRLVARPQDLPGWLGLAECLAMSTGAFLLFRGKGDGFGRVCVLLFGATCVMFGVSHFVFAKFTASMVPAWLPNRLELAYLTGAIHTLTGLALIIGRWRRWAATIEAAVMSSFVLLVHAPRVAAHPTDRTELTLPSRPRPLDDDIDRLKGRLDRGRGRLGRRGRGRLGRRRRRRRDLRQHRGRGVLGVGELRHQRAERGAFCRGVGSFRQFGGTGSLAGTVHLLAVFRDGGEGGRVLGYVHCRISFGANPAMPVPIRDLEGARWRSSHENHPPFSNYRCLADFGARMLNHQVANTEYDEIRDRGIVKICYPGLF